MSRRVLFKMIVAFFIVPRAAVSSRLLSACRFQVVMVLCSLFCGENTKMSDDVCGMRIRAVFCYFFWSASFMLHAQYGMYITALYVLYGMVQLQYVPYGTLHSR